MPQERLALAYSDGSFGVLADGTSLEKAREEREFCDHNENNSRHLTDIVLVRIEQVSVVEKYRKPEAA